MINTKMQNRLQKWFHSNAQELQLGIYVRDKHVEGFLTKKHSDGPYHEIDVYLPISCFYRPEIVKELRQAVEACGCKVNIYLR